MCRRVVLARRTALWIACSMPSGDVPTISVAR